MLAFSSVRLAGCLPRTDGTTSGPSRSEVKYRTALSTSWRYSWAPVPTTNIGETAAAGEVTLTWYTPGTFSPEKLSW